MTPGEKNTVASEYKYAASPSTRPKTGKKFAETVEKLRRGATREGDDTRSIGFIETALRYKKERGLPYHKDLNKWWSVFGGNMRDAVSRVTEVNAWGGAGFRVWV